MMLAIKIFALAALVLLVVALVLVIMLCGVMLDVIHDLKAMSGVERD